MNRLSLLTRGAAIAAGLTVAAGSVACTSDKGTTNKSSDGGSTTAQTDTDVASAPTSKGDPAKALDRAVVADGKLAHLAFDLQFGLTLNSQDTRFRISGKVDRAADASEITGSAQGVTIELRTQGDTAWVRGGTPAFRAAMPAGKAWVKGSLRELVGAGVLAPVNGSAALLYYLYGAKDIKRRSTEQLDRVEVTPYTFAVDRARAEQRAPANRRDEVHKLMTGSGSTILSITGEVWLDRQGHVHRLLANGRLGHRAAGSSELTSAGRIDYQLRQRDFDQKVTIDQPSPSETVDIKSVPGVLDTLKQQPRSDSGSGSDSSS